MITNQIKSITNSFKETACSSYELAKTKNKSVSLADFVMQVQPNWMFYLAYTAIRCATLGLKYKNLPKEKRYEIFEKAQLYSSIKVIGLIVSQIALSILGLTTPASVGLILCWGLVLASASNYAHKKTHVSEC